jgi:hypothetical protein
MLILNEMPTFPGVTPCTNPAMTGDTVSVAANGTKYQAHATLHCTSQWHRWTHSLGMVNATRVLTVRPQ